MPTFRHAVVASVAPGSGCDGLKDTTQASKAAARYLSPENSFERLVFPFEIGVIASPSCGM